jgi:hypothetical protein
MDPTDKLLLLTDLVVSVDFNHYRLIGFDGFQHGLL